MRRIFLGLLVVAIVYGIEATSDYFGGGAAAQLYGGGVGSGSLSPDSNDWQRPNLQSSRPCGFFGPGKLNPCAMVNPDGSIQVQPVVPTMRAAGGAYTITNSSVTYVPQAASRRMIAIDNESTSATIACSFGGTAATNTAGSWTIPPGSTRTWLPPAPIPLDAINCISSAATSAATIQVQ